MWICSNESRQISKFKKKSREIFLGNWLSYKFIIFRHMHIWGLSKIFLTDAKNRKPQNLMLVKTAHLHSATCNLAQWLTIYYSPTIYPCFALPQLLYRRRYQSEYIGYAIVNINFVIYWSQIIFRAARVKHYHEPESEKERSQQWAQNFVCYGPTVIK
jgi:hypothetical protein